MTLAWDASTNASVMGYKIYYGTESGVYDSSVDTGTNTCVTITNLQPGQVYYIAATDYDTNGWESPFSDEFSYLVPGIIKLVTSPSRDLPAMLLFPVAPGHWYELQATADLILWTTIYQTRLMEENYWVEFMDFESFAEPRRYYRLCLH